MVQWYCSTFMQVRSHVCYFGEKHFLLFYLFWWFFYHYYFDFFAIIWLTEITLKRGQHFNFSLCNCVLNSLLDLNFIPLYLWQLSKKRLAGYRSYLHNSFHKRSRIYFVPYFKWIIMSLQASDFKWLYAITISKLFSKYFSTRK